MLTQVINCHKTMLRFIPLLLIILMFSCSTKSSNEDRHADFECSEDTCADFKCPDPPALDLYLQPCDGISNAKIKQIKKSLDKVFFDFPELSNTSITILPHLNLPDSLLYQPRNRYWAGKIIRYQKDSLQEYTLRITDKDISTSIRGNFNYGIIGLSEVGGKSGVVSTFRVRNDKTLSKAILHEYLHLIGLPHCQTKTCIMADGEGKGDFSNKNDLCMHCADLLSRKFEDFHNHSNS